MSPEQAEGKPLDTRSDIFSFGALLYQMLSGRPPFPGSSTASTRAAILREDPPPLGAKFPGELEKTMMRCLRKDSAHRFQHIDDVKVELEDLQAEAAAGKLDSDPPRGVRRPRQWRRIAAGLLAVLAGLLIGAWLFSAAPAIDVTKHRYSPVALESPLRPIGYVGGNGTFLPSWSPDGTSIVYSADRVRVQSIDGVKSTPLAPPGGECPFFSSDGSRVYYFISGQKSRELWSVSVAGGTPEVVFSDLGGNTTLLEGAAESPDGRALAVIRPAKNGAEEMSVWVSEPPRAPPREYPNSPTARDLLRSHLRFSPDGSKLLLTLAPRRGPVQWWLLRWPPPKTVQPNTVRCLFENGPRGSFGTAADWLADNRHLIAAIHIDRYMGGPLWIAGTVTGTWQRITPGPFLCAWPRVSRSGRVLFHMPRTEEHAVEIPLDGSPIHPLISGLPRQTPNGPVDCG